MFTISLWSAGILTYSAGNLAVASVCVGLWAVVIVAGMFRRGEDSDAV